MRSIERIWFLRETALGFSFLSRPGPFDRRPTRFPSATRRLP